ncbi:MAG: type II toxin-antitoxin system RelE/ParE family toxin [Phycisphaerales bacterium]
MIPVELTDAAREDTRERIDYFFSFGWPSAQRFVEELDAVFARLGAYPELGRERADLGEHVRSFPFRDHLVFYRRDRHRLLVLRVVHGSREISIQMPGSTRE